MLRHGYYGCYDTVRTISSVLVVGVEIVVGIVGSCSTVVIVVVAPDWCVCVCVCCTGGVVLFVHLPGARLHLERGSLAPACSQGLRMCSLCECVLYRMCSL